MDAKIHTQKVNRLADGIVSSFAVEYPQEGLMETGVNRIVVQESLSFVLRNIKAIQQVNADSDDIQLWKDVFWEIAQNYQL